MQERVCEDGFSYEPNDILKNYLLFSLLINSTHVFLDSTNVNESIPQEL
jgi:hypothetical protein